MKKLVLSLTAVILTGVLGTVTAFALPTQQNEQTPPAAETFGHVDRQDPEIPRQSLHPYICHSYLDADGNGFCDNCENGRGHCYEDDDGDGLCDNCNRPNPGNGYADDLCDNCAADPAGHCYEDEHGVCVHGDQENGQGTCDSRCQEQEDHENGNCGNQADHGNCQNGRRQCGNRGGGHCGGGRRGGCRRG